MAIKPHRRPIPAEVRKSIVAAYREQPAKHVALSHGVHLTTVLTIVRQFGEPVRPPNIRVQKP